VNSFTFSINLFNDL